VELTEKELAALARAERKARGRRRALDRSRRATNTNQYGLSKRQRKRAQRRKEVGLAERQVTVPGGARAANATGVPKRAYRTDTLSAGYRQGRARIAQAAATTAEAKDHRARRIAADIVGEHGANLVVEDRDIRAWFRLWGKKPRPPPPAGSSPPSAASATRPAAASRARRPSRRSSRRRACAAHRSARPSPTASTTAPSAD
jgi:hypothetical protein